MSGKKLVELHNRWRGFTAERGRAKRDLLDVIEVKQAQIAALREDIINLETAFDDEWRQKKIDLQEARDKAVMDELATGRSAQSILRELGSNNTVWIYELRGRVQAAQGIPEPSNQNTLTHGTPHLSLVPPATPTQSMPLVPVLPDVTWLHHNHQGVVGWLISEDRHYVKRHGVPGSDFEGQWFVCDRSHNFIGGSRELFDATAKGEVTKRSNSLESLLDGTYAGRVKEVENPFTD